MTALVQTLAQVEIPQNFDVAQNIFFAIIAAVMLFSSFKMVTTGNVVHAALYLVVVLAGSAALFLLLGSDFVGATQILVYIGAIIVLFLFGIMLTKAQLGDDDSVHKERRSMGALVGILLFAVMAFALIDTFGNDQIEFSNPEPVLFETTTFNIEDLPTPVATALNLDGQTGPFELTQADFEAISDGDLTTMPANLDNVEVPSEVLRRIPGAELFGNSKQIADSIFTDYIVPFEAVSVLLLAALIGAVVVARKE